MTKLPQSTISFNTEPYLRQVLDSLVSSCKIQSYMYIEHQPEEDTKKSHIHLLVVPSSVLNPVVFRKEFIETSFGNRDLGCLPFKTSKLCDWLLYAIHYEPYLFSKGLVRTFTYNLNDIVTNEPFEYVEQIFSEAREGLTTSRIDSFLSRAMSGASFGDLMAEGLVPPNQVIFYDKLYRSKCRVSRVVEDDTPF